MLIEYIHNHQAEFWIVLGFALLSIEVITGMVTGILLFSSVGALVTGLFMLLGLLPETWTAGISSTAICSGVAMLLLWKPLRNLQNSDIPEKDNSSDLVGYTFVLQENISLMQPGKTRYSGIDWKVEIDTGAGVEQIDAGQRVKVSSVEVGKFLVRPVQNNN